MPPGIQPPIVVQFNASSVPVLQLSLNSDNLNEQQLYDFGIYRVRQQLAPVPGVTLPTPAGGKYRQIMVDIDPDKLLSRGLTPLDIVNAVNTQNLTLPSGTAKMGDIQYTVRTNATPATIDDLNKIPVKFTNGATILLKDVAQVRDGSMVQQNIVREDGRRSVLLNIIKNGNASTLAVVNGVKKALTAVRAAAPPGLKITELFDQSVFVTNSVNGVLREGAIAAGLTAMMILLFLGSWRSTLVVMISIPLAILSSLVVLYFLGETLNTMTLGGLALAVGILVDDSTVTIENTHRLWTEEGMSLADATLHGAAEIAVPTLVHPCHQLRVHVGGVPGGASQIPVYAAGTRRRICDACLLRIVANADTDHDWAAAEGRAPACPRRGPRRAVLAPVRRLRSQLRAVA
ncbi:multidrug efflux pump subunit AcrB [Bradyrhizobium sp. LB1.3]